MQDIDYRTDSEYEVYYATGLSPVLIRLALALQAVKMPEGGDGEPFRYLELGYGMGLSIDIHNCVFPGDYWGTDFLPIHAETANLMAKAAGITPHLYCNSFADMDEMSKKGELPQFDVIGFHGIWSWINDENRQHMLNIVDRNLKKGGVVYNSYNTMPGWNFFMPIRELMALNAERLGEDRDILQRTRETVDFVKQFSQSGAAFFANNPAAVAEMDKIAKASVNYLAQEYLNRSWYPFYFSQVAEPFQNIGCSFISSTNLISQTGALVPDGTRPLLMRMLNPVMRETVRDFATNQRFRTDLFVREPVRMNSRDHLEHLGKQALLLARERNKIPMAVKTITGTLALDKTLYGPILEYLEEGGMTAKPIAPLLELNEFKNNPKLLIECISFLVGGNFVMPAQLDVKQEALDATAKMNRELCRMATEGRDMKWVASSTTGIGIILSDVEKMYLYYMSEGKTTPDEMAKAAFTSMVNRGLKLSYDESLPKLVDIANKLMEQMPRLKALGVPF